MSDTQFLTRSEVARLLGVSPNTVTRWVREGRLACLVTLGGITDSTARSSSRFGSSNTGQSKTATTLERGDPPTGLCLGR